MVSNTARRMTKVELCCRLAAPFGTLVAQVIIRVARPSGMVIIMRCVRD